MFPENRTSIIVCYSRKDVDDIVRRMYNRRLVQNFRQAECFIKGYFENWKIVPIKNIEDDHFAGITRGFIFDNAYFDKFCYCKEYENILMERRVKKILTVEDLLKGEL